MKVEDFYLTDPLAGYVEDDLVFYSNFVSIFDRHTSTLMSEDFVAPMISEKCKNPITFVITVSRHNVSTNYNTEMCSFHLSFLHEQSQPQPSPFSEEDGQFRE